MNPLLAEIVLILDRSDSMHGMAASVANRIRHQTEKLPCQFLFPRGNQDAIAIAGRMNIQATNTANIAMTGRYSDFSKAAPIRKMSAVRRGSHVTADAATVRGGE